jgi:phosphoribosylformimino-5-aminoimidazole carboxamide ribotide isomerase
MELIPAIDLKGGRVVRLLQGDFDAETRYFETPSELYERYVALGAKRLHVVDLDAARGQADHASLWAPLAADGRLRVQLGGGLRTPEALQRAFDAGIDRAVLGSIAVTDPSQVGEWFRIFGAQRFVLALDVRVDTAGIPRLTTHGWLHQSEVSLWDAVAHYATLGLQHVLCTDVSRDGALSGPNLALYTEAVDRFPAIAWQASGGVRNASDLSALRAMGVAAAVSGRALLEGGFTVEELQPFLPAA